MELWSKRRTPLIVCALILAGVGLSGCFDLVQTVGIDRSGSGHYQIAVTADGLVGQALKNEKLVNDRNHAQVQTTDVNGKVTRTATVAFKSLDDLAFSDEKMSLGVRSRDFFGLGATHCAFHATFLVDRAKNRNPQTAQNNQFGERIAQSILGDHTYVFTVTVPGSVERAAPVVLGGQSYAPSVSGDFYNGHTVTWRVPLYALVNTQALDFEVDFAAMGFFSDAKSQMVAKE